MIENVEKNLLKISRKTLWNKRFKNTYCPFNLSVKMFKEISSDELPCIIYIEHAHNHPIKTLQSLNFKSVPDFVASFIRQLTVVQQLGRGFQ